MTITDILLYTICVFIYNYVVNCAYAHAHTQILYTRSGVTMRMRTPWSQFATFYATKMWNVCEWKTALFLGVFCALPAPYLSEENTAKLSVQYPVSGNYSIVRATCRDVSGDKLSSAEFLKNGTVLTSGPESHQVTIINDTGDGEISFSFTQEQEGVFSCGKGKNRSAGIGLAGKNYMYICLMTIFNLVYFNTASPSKNYDGLSVPHYVTCPRANISPVVSLSCPIRPGVLTDSYRVTWRDLSEESASESSNESFTLLVKPTELSSYQCVIHIQHRSDHYLLQWT